MRCTVLPLLYILGIMLNLEYKLINRLDNTTPLLPPRKALSEGQVPERVSLQF